MPEEASGYLNGVVHGGSSSSTASATQGSRLSKSGSAPSLVEAAAVKLENQRLREEIRAMCNTIKSQSSQLSELWAETQRLQARKNGKRCRTASNVSNLMAGVAELSRMQLDPGNSSGARAGFPRARSAGSLISGGLPGADSERGPSGWSSALGQPMQPGPAGDFRPHEVSHNADANCEGMQSAQVPTLAKEQGPNSKGMRDGTIDAQFRHIPSYLSDLISQDPDSSKDGLPATLASDLYKLHTSSKHPFDGRSDRSGQSQKRLPLFTPKITPLPESYRYTLDRAAQNGGATLGPATFGANGKVVSASPNLCEPGYSAVMQDVAGSRFPHSSGVPGVGGSNGIAGILEPTTLQGTKAEPELPIRGAVSLFIMAQNLNLSMLSAKSDLAASFRATIQEDIARELGPGFTPEHVDVRLLAESAAIPVTITAPSGVSCHDLHRCLCNKPLRWAGNKSSKLSTLEGFSAVCLSPSWCLCTIGMPSIVDEASTTVSGGSPLALQVSLAQDLPAVPDEQDLVLPRCLQRTGHTPRDDPGKPPRASPKRRSMAKAPTSSAKVKRNPREAKPNRENSSARQLNFSGLSDTPYYQPMLLGEGFGEETEHISGLFVPSVDATFDSRMSSPQTEERMKSRSHGVNGVVTQPNKQPIESPKRPDVTLTSHPAFSRNSSDEEVTFIEDDSVSTPARAAAPRRVGALGSRRSVGVEQPSAASKRLSNTRSRTSSGHSAGPAPKSMPKVEPKETAPAAASAPAAPAALASEERPVVPRAPVVPAAPVPAVPASTPAPTPVETAGYVPTAAAVAGEKTAAEVVEPKPKTEVFQAESEEESESSEASSEGESEEESGDGVTQVRPRRKSTSAEVKDLIGDDSDDSDESDSEEVERAEVPTRTAPRTSAESLLSKE